MQCVAAVNRYQLCWQSSLWGQSFQGLNPGLLSPQIGCFIQIVPNNSLRDAFKLPTSDLPAPFSMIICKEEEYLHPCDLKFLLCISAVCFLLGEKKEKCGLCMSITSNEV